MAIDYPQPPPPPPPKPPLTLHELILPYILLIIALSIPTHRQLVSAVFLPLLWRSYYNLSQTTSPSPPAAFIAGAFVASHAYYSFDLLVFRDPRTKFRMTDSYIIAASRNGSNGSTIVGASPKPEKEEGEPYPQNSLPRRIGWVLDLVCSMRGIGWNWAIKPIPPIPAAETMSLRVFLRRRVTRLLLIWAWLDASMFWAHYLDAAYFLPEGNAYSVPGVLREPVYASLFSASSKAQEYPPPRGFPTIPSSGVQRMAYQLLLHSFRAVLQGALIYTSMNGVYTGVALVFASLGGLVGLGKPGGWRRRWLDWRTWPDIFGGWREGDWGHGLTGWWGKAWHGLLKHMFTSPSRYAINTFNIPPSSPVTIALSLFTPFIMSAALHFLGSYIVSSDGWGNAWYFLAQPFGVILEQAFLYLYRRAMPPPSRNGRDSRSMPRRALERWIPYVWVVSWCVLTSKPFFEDLRHGGVWAMQPVPVSVWKGLWGIKEGWWPWTKETDMGWREWWEWDSSLGGWGIRL